MSVTRYRYRALTAVTAGLALSAATAHAASVPTNLCSLHVSPTTLRALHVTGSCLTSGTSRSKGRTDEAATWGAWGTGNNTILVTTFTGISKSSFQEHIAVLPGGTPVPIGSWAREWPLGDTVTIDVWTGSVGLTIGLLPRKPLTPPASSQRFVAPMQVFAKAVVAQI
jgi:hypothetical protein